jgi:hypothetical protein
MRAQCSLNMCAVFSTLKPVGQFAQILGVDTGGHSSFVHCLRGKYENL